NSRATFSTHYRWRARASGGPRGATAAGARRRSAVAPMKSRDDVGGELRELIERALGRAHRPQDELGAAAGHVLLEPLTHEVGGPEGRAAGQRGVVDAPARDERRG